VRALLDDHLGDLAHGLWVSLQLTGVGFAAGVVIGVIVATMRISPIPPLRAVGMVYVEIFRNVPLMSLIILLVYALPGLDLTLGFLPSVFVALALVGGAFVCEALRSGVNSINAGQIEAARSLGLTFAQILAQVVFPQAFRAMVQPLVTILIGLFLSSSLAGVVGVLDLTQMTNRINNREAIGLMAFVGAAGVYVVISLLIGWAGSAIERRVRVVR
jgi:glutamate transport system permease protein